MDTIKLNLIRQALKLHKKIYPCGTKATLAECFTLERDKVLFWYDTEDRSTHLVMAKSEAALA